MLKPIEVNFKLDKTIKRALTTELMIKSHDINVIEFHIAFDGLELTADHTVKVLSVFNDTKSQTNVTCNIVDGKAIYRPDTSIISQYEHVLNYVYVYHGDQSLDVRLFTYSVDSSEIDKTAIKVKTVYDQTYTELLTEFEARLQDYKDSLPQASDLRAEVDVILDKFKVDSVAKLNQYDADAQQVIADNQTAFDSAESNRQATYEQAEDSRNQASEQAITDFGILADESIGAKLGEIQTDADSAINQFKQDGANEITDWRGVADDGINQFNQNSNAEIADWRTSADSELEDYLAGRVVLKNLVKNGDFSDGLTGWFTSNYTASVIDGVAVGKVNALATSIVYFGSAFPKIKDHNYYTSFHLVPKYSNATRILVGDKWSEFTYPEPEEINVISEIVTSGVTGADASNGFRLCHHTDVNYVIGDEVIFDNVLSIDLTAAFGAGNEPTKAEMDELIKITGYFDEITLTQKQMLNWQLKLMRQNRNALIALGGTII